MAKREKLIDIYGPASHPHNWYRFSVYPNESVRPDHGRYSPCCSYLKPSELSYYKPSEVWLSVNYAGGSDYSGSALERANWRWFEENYGSHKKVCCIDHGGHGTFEVYLRGDLYNPDIIEVLNGLDDYPIIDESLMSEIEIDWQNEYLNESWNRREIAEFVAEQSPAIAEVDPETITELLWDINQKGNGLEWEYCGTGATLILRERQFEDYHLPELIRLGVRFTLIQDWQEQLTSLRRSELYHACADHGVTLKDENDNEIELPDWAYPNPNQLTIC